MEVALEITTKRKIDMNEAKIRREALRKTMLELGMEWDFPPSQWEAAVCAELEEMPAITVRPATAEQLAWMRMPANKCHDNARWYTKNDPTKQAQAVTGWWVQWPNYVLHSVVKTSAGLTCITPGAFEVAEFPFIPDAKIRWIENGETYSFIRDGHEIGPGVRKYPEFTMAQNAIVRERLLAGMKPYKAVEFTDAEMLELKRRYIVSSTL